MSFGLFFVKLNLLKSIYLDFLIDFPYNKSVDLFSLSVDSAQNFPIEFIKSSFIVGSVSSYVYPNNALFS